MFLLYLHFLFLQVMYIYLVTDIVIGNEPYIDIPGSPGNP